MPINPNIAMGVKGIELENPLNQFARFAQIQGAQRENALAQMKMDEYNRSLEEQNRLRAYLEGSDVTTPEGRKGLIKFGKAGVELGKGLLEQEKEAALRKKADVDLVDAKLKQSRAFLDTIDPNDPNAAGQYIAWHEANHKDPILGPALSARGVTAEQSRANIMEKLNQPGGLAMLINQSKLGAEKFMELNKPTTHVIDQSGQRQVIQIPGLGGKPTTVGTYADVPLPAEVQAQKQQVARAGAPSISVSTEKKYGEAFGGKIADVDITKMSAAEQAPNLAESANRIIGLVQQGNVFTGPVADVKLNIARGLNVAGASNEEKIANTEQLIAATGKSTIDAIKGAGLGTGQGFTDKDLKFLQGVAGGTINLTPQTLTELARLQHLAATKSAEAWNKRVKEMPQDVVRGTGLSTAPITVPPLSSVAKRPAAPAASNIDALLDKYK